MGGSRCTYQNCSQKSDQKTHMFHYPVFDKIRCHQWITNAQKLNYLNLKLSQLKNRMVCQHHFTDDCFMNVMKNKLKKYAIPTESGPFCAKSYVKEDNEAQDNIESEMPINIDDIENEFSPMMNRRAHFSVKYGDFLTNDNTEVFISDYKKTSIQVQDDGMVFNRYMQKRRSCLPTEQRNEKVVTNFTKANNGDKMKTIAELPTFENQLPNANTVSIELDELNLFYPLDKSSDHNQIRSSEPVCPTPPKPNLDQATIKLPSNKRSAKVKIISEKNISEPVNVPLAELQPVSPSVVIKVPNKKSRSNIEINGKEINTLYVDDTNTMATFSIPPQAPVTEPTNLNTYTQHTINIDEMGLNSLAIQNELKNPLQDTKKFNDCLPLEANQSVNNSQQLKQESEILNNNQNMPTIPNVEFVSGSLTGPTIYTITDVPQASTLVEDHSYSQNISQVPQKALISTNTEMLAASQGCVANNPIRNIETLPGPKNMLLVNQKPSLKTNSPNKSMARYKMPPEKLAAIEEKRKYNMKLRDIINSCLNKMDVDPEVAKLTAAMKKEMGSKKVGDHIAKDSTQPQSQENFIAYFEARLQRLENNLQNRIEHNSQNIFDLKKTLKQTANKKAASTQTYFSADSTKRSLYQQIVQYLTPEINSLIYEELFINQRISKAEPKMRKRKINNSDQEL